MILPKTKEIEDYLKLRKKLGVLQFVKDIRSNRKAYEVYEVKKKRLFTNGKKHTISMVKRGC